MAGDETLKKIKKLIDPDESAINSDYNIASSGLNMDQTVTQIGKGTLTYALNAAVENFDANSVNYQNEQGNQRCFNFPQGYRLIGEHSIYEQNKHIFFLHNPETGKSEIGYMENNDCQYKTYINADCLNFNVNHPIHKVIHKVTNCTTEIYWTDGINPRRYLDLSSPPYRTEPSTQLPCLIDTFPDIDCNKLKIQPNFKIPQIDITEIRNDGNLISGTYQFAIQYCDSAANGYTSYYSITNPTPISDPNALTLNFDYNVGKSIVVNISNLDVTGYFEYYNLAVIKTVNSVSSVELVGTYFIDKASEKIIYSGQKITDKTLTILDIFEKFPYYDIAQDLTAVQDILIWDNLTSIDRVNYQEIANNINLQWESYRIPETENYSNELSATNLRGYLRDEVYAFEIVFLLKNGRQTDGFHIPGRLKNGFENTAPDIPEWDQDFIGSPTYYDSAGIGYSPYWKIYNTGSVTGFSPEYTTAQDYKGPYQYGEFGYWESEEEYPCNTDIYGSLAGQKIRHHKFPDVLVSPIFESKIFTTASNMVMSSNAVLAMGVRIDPNQVKNLVQFSSLPQDQKDDIVGFKIVRGDRANHKSVIAKGMLRNVGSYNREGTDYYFPNYPYNDLREDPFLMAQNNAFVVNTGSNNNIRCRSFTIHVGKFEFARIQFVDCTTNQLAILEIDNTQSSVTTTRKICTLSFPKPDVLQGRVFITGNTYSRYKITAYNANISVVQPSILKNGNSTCALGWEFPYCNFPVYPNGNPCCGWPPGVFGWIEQCLYGCDNSSCDNGLDVAYRCSGVLTYVTHNMVTKFDPQTGQDVGRSFYIDSLIPPQCVGGNCTDLTIEKLYDVDDPICSVTSLKAFDNPNNKYRLVFNSPETSFGKPFLGNVLRLENVIYGAGQAHFVQVKDNAFYKLLSREAQEDAYVSSAALAGSNYSALFAAYQAYLTIYVNGITRRNYSWSFNSIARYSYHNTIANGLGIKQRNLDIARYINPTVQSVNDTIDINNWNRESSVYLRTDLNKSSLLYPKDVPSLQNPNTLTSIVEDNSRFVNSDPRADCNKPGKLIPINTVVYYASVKKTLPSQYGQLYQYDTIDTGYQIDIPSINSSTDRLVFGGDTFISAFSFKIKLPFFIENRVGAPDDSDVFYDEIGNVAYPKYWHSSRSVLSNSPSPGGLTNFISIKAHNFDCPNSQLSNFGSIANSGRTYYDGKMYQFAYGIPYFYCESGINVDLRQAFNDREGQFWPKVSTGIPDDWVQESKVPIAQDNTYYYNVTFSKQNKENFFSHLPLNWEPKLCFTAYPYRAIYSDRQQSYLDSEINNWLIYRPVSAFDFPQNYGKLTSLDGIQNRAVLARFENKTLLYNKLLVIDTSNPQAAYIGNSNLFLGAPPMDFAETDLGYVGSQNKMLLKIPQGQITVDAKRGQVFLLTNEGATDLSAFGSGMNRFFTDHLAFEILRYFPDFETIVNGERILVPGVNTDNHYNGIGLHGVYDSKFDRVIITKIDYVPKSDKVKYDYSKKEFYIEELLAGTPTRTVIMLSNEDYFCNKSWTLSFNLNINRWISFHSYIPNWYIAENNFFYSGINGCCNAFDADGFEALATSNLSQIANTTTTTTTLGGSTTTTTSSSTSTSTSTSTTSTSTSTTSSTTSTTTTSCRPLGQIEALFITGYNPGTGPIVSTGSFTDACSALNYLTWQPIGSSSITQITVTSSSFILGSPVYLGAGSSCTPAPNGWYVYNEQVNIDGTYELGDFIYQIVGGVIAQLVPCTVQPTTTSTTSTSSTTSTTSTTTTLPPTTTTTTTL